MKKYKVRVHKTNKRVVELDDDEIPVTVLFHSNMFAEIKKFLRFSL